jgi:hypothetical protein
MKIISLSALFLSICFHIQGQNLIGSSQKEILEYMKKNYSEMNRNNVVNEKFKYLKYSDNEDSQTFLFFLDSDSICKNIRLICAKGLKDQKTKEFNTNYIKSGANEWIQKKNGKEYLIEVFDEKWSFIVTIEQKK